MTFNAENNKHGLSTGVDDNSTIVFNTDLVHNIGYEKDARNKKS